MVIRFLSESSGSKMSLPLRHFLVLAIRTINSDKGATKYQNVNTFKMHCKWRKSRVRFPDRKARNPSYQCTCVIA